MNLGEVPPGCARELGDAGELPQMPGSRFRCSMHLGVASCPTKLGSARELGDAGELPQTAGSWFRRSMSLGVASCPTRLGCACQLRCLGEPSQAAGSRSTHCIMSCASPPRGVDPPRAAREDGEPQHFTRSLRSSNVNSSILAPCQKGCASAGL